MNIRLPLSDTSRDGPDQKLTLTFRTRAQNTDECGLETRASHDFSGSLSDGPGPHLHWWRMLEATFSNPHMAMLCTTVEHQRRIIRLLTEQNIALAQQIATVQRRRSGLGVSMPGLTREQTDALPLVGATSASDGTCCLCLDDLCEDQCCRLPCGHVHHHKCVSKWLVLSPLCPLCKGVAWGQS